ncbi:MAG: DivIVA domain-containing protein [Candidatus Cloacimonetes bacterium]|nr:DivIVA domain-containing protein [Candidatus Cloacimonadota bacterium]
MEGIELTPADIRHKEFTAGMLGYSKTEVKEFLEIISNQMEDYILKISELEKLVEKDDYPQIEKHVDIEEKPQTPREELISRTLLLAEKTKEEILANARREAENLLKEAEFNTKKTIEEARHYLNVLEHQYMNIKEQKKQFLLQFKSELEGLLGRISKDTILNKDNEVQMDNSFKQIKEMKSANDTESESDSENNE